MPLKPTRLSSGDTIGLVAPASPPAELALLEQGIEALERLGFTIKLGRHIRKRRGFLAGTDRERAEDLMNMFRDKRVRAVICVRGGYGTARLLPLLDFELIRRHPKIFAGHSDVTTLHCGLLKRSNLVSFHGPMIISDFSKPDTPRFTVESFLRTVMQPSAAGSIVSRPAELQSRSLLQEERADLNSVSILRSGKAVGELLGGNLSVLCTTIGTAYQPSFRRKILFLEDLNEPPYRVDRMLTHLLNAGLLQQVSGVAIGIYKNCNDAADEHGKEERQTLDVVLRERLRPLRVPVVAGLPFGHVPYNATLPLGLSALLDGVSGDLVITESAVQ